MDGTKDNTNKRQFTINVPSIIDLLPQKYITPLASYNDNYNMPKTGEVENNSHITTQENATQSINPTSIFIHEATPDSKTNNANRLEDKDEYNGDDNTKDVPSSYVVDRVDLIAKEIDESKISATE